MSGCIEGACVGAGEGDRLDGLEVLRECSEDFVAERNVAEGREARVENCAVRISVERGEHGRSTIGSQQPLGGVLWAGEDLQEAREWGGAQGRFEPV